MLQNETVTVIGAGNIGRALIGGLIEGHEFESAQLRATRRTETALHALQKDFPGISTTSENPDAVQGATIVILAVKPQNFAEVVEEIKDSVHPETLVISVLAGIATRALEEAFGQRNPVVRSMPNTPAIVDEAASALAAGRFAESRHVELAEHIFQAVGAVEVVPEYMMDAITGLSGSGPAYVYMFIEALTDAGVKQGLPRPTAFRLAAQTVYGAAKLVRDTGKHPAILRDEVTTPGGTAIAAVAELEAHGIRTMLINAVATASKRSAELREE